MSYYQSVANTDGILAERKTTNNFTLPNYSNSQNSNITITILFYVMSVCLLVLSLHSLSASLYSCSSVPIPYAKSPV